MKIMKICHDRHMENAGRPWRNTPPSAHRGLEATYRRVRYWTDRAARAVFNGDKEEDAHARTMLDETLLVAYERMGIDTAFSTPATSASIISDYTQNQIQALETRELYNLAAGGLNNDPIAELVISRELVRRNQLSGGIVADPPKPRLPLTGTVARPARRPLPPGKTPWRGRENYRRAGHNGYPATYHEMLVEYAAGGDACERNEPMEAYILRHSASQENEKSRFLAGVWKSGWRKRREQILHAQVEAGLGDNFPDLDEMS